VAEVRAVVEAQAVDLAACQSKASGERVKVALTAKKGRVSVARTAGSVDADAWACMKDVLADGAYPPGDWSVTASLRMP